MINLHKKTNNNSIDLVKNELDSYKNTNKDSDIIKLIHNIYELRNNKNSIEYLVNKFMLWYTINLLKENYHYFYQDNKELFNVLESSKEKNENTVIINKKEKNIILIVHNENVHNIIADDNFQPPSMQTISKNNMNTSHYDYSTINKNVRSNLNLTNNCILYYEREKITMYLYTNKNNIHYRTFTMGNITGDKKLVRKLIPGNYQKFSILGEQLDLFSRLVNSSLNNDADNFRKYLYRIITSMHHNNSLIKRKIYKKDKRILKKFESYYNISSTDKYKAMQSFITDYNNGYFNDFVKVRVNNYNKFSNFFVEHGSNAFPILVSALFGMVFADKIKENININKEDLADHAAGIYDKYDTASDIWDSFGDLFDNDYCGCDGCDFDGCDMGGCDGCDGCGLDGCF